MAKQKLKLTGLLYWARVFEENRDMVGYQDAYKECDGAYTLDLIITEKEADKLRATNTQKKLKEVILKEDGSVVNYDSLSRAEKKEIDDEDIFYKVKLVRKHKEKFDTYGGAPKVLKKDGSSWSFEEDGTIGNGSTGEVSIETYTLNSGLTGTRYSQVKVLEHVKFNSQEEPEEEVKPTPKKKEVEDDDIPF